MRKEIEKKNDNRNWHESNKSNNNKATAGKRES